MTEDTPYLGIIMPVFNEEKNLVRAINAISAQCEILRCSFEILIINDASTDGSAQLIAELQETRPYLKVVRHNTNQGIGASIVTGVQHSQSKTLIFIPADLGMDICFLKDYMEASRRAHIVVGLRSDRRDYSLFRKLVSFINITLIQILFRMPQKQFNHICLYRRDIFKKILIESRSAFFAAEIMIKARDLGYKIVEIPVGYIAREHGKSVAAKPKWLYRALKDMFRFWFKWTFETKNECSNC